MALIIKNVICVPSFLPRLKFTSGSTKDSNKNEKQVQGWGVPQWGMPHNN